jgi:hypothetical protein
MSFGASGRNQLTIFSSQRTGLVLLILVVVQALFGTMLKLASKTKIQDPDRVPSIKGHPLQNFLHILTGVSSAW